MPVSVIESTLSGLLDSDFHVKLFNLRFIKNEIIGSCNKKLKYLQSGLLSEIEKILSNEAHPSLLIEACVIVGSLAYGDKECLTALFASNLLPTLTLFLNHKDDNVAEAAIRSIKIVYTCDFTYKFTLKDESLLVVVELLSSSSATIVENALKLISISCRTPERQLLVVNYPNLSAVKKIIEFLSSHNPKLQESSLQTLASLIHSNKQAAKVILCNFPDLQKTLYHFLKRTPDSIRLAACCCLAYLNKLNMLNNKSALFSMLLPLLVRLSSSGTPTIRIQSLNTLAFFIAEEPKLQKAACESELLKNLHEAFDNTRNDNERDLIQYQESALLALAAVCHSQEECRHQVVDAKIIPFIIASLKSEYTGLRVAACECCRSLSRSVKNLRTAMAEKDLVSLLSSLLTDPAEEVQIAACEALCNVILEFSPMKDEVINNGGVTSLIGLTFHKNVALRLNATWAVKNLLYLSSTQMHEAVMDALTWKQLLNLLKDQDPKVQEQALKLLRNLSSGDKEEGEKNINRLLNNFGEELKEILPSVFMGANATLIIDGLYTCSNIASGNEEHKNYILSNNALLNAVRDNLLHENPEARIAATWCVLNLTWREPGRSSPAENKYIEALSALEIHKRLEILISDSHKDVAERAKAALQQ